MIDSFTSFPIWMPCIYFSCLIALAGTSIAMWIEVMEAGDFVFFSDLRGKASSLWPLSVMLAVGFLCWIFFFLALVSFGFFFFLNHERVLEFSNAFSASVEMMCFFFSPLFYLCSLLHWLLFVCWINLAFLDKFQLVILYNLLNMQVDLFC